MSVVSVISSVIRLGGVPVWASVRAIRCRKPASLSSRAATLTLDPDAVREQPGLQAGALEHPVADRGDQARAALGDGQEVTRPSNPCSGCCQRTSASTATVRSVSTRQDRLVDETQLVLRDRAPQPVLDPQPVAQAARHRAVEDLERVAAAALDALHGGVRALDEVGAVACPVPRSRSRSPLRRGIRLPAVDRARAASRSASSAASRSSSHSASTANSSPPTRASGCATSSTWCRRVATSISTSSPAACPWVSLTARNRSRPINRTRQALALRAGERLLEPFLEQQPVRQAGERVVQRLVGDALLQPTRFGDVAHRDHHAGDRAVRNAVQRRVVGRDLDLRAVRARRPAA